MKVLVTPVGLTVRQLKAYLAQIPELTAVGEEAEIWIETGRGLSSPVIRLSPLNVRETTCDVLLESAAFNPP